MSEQLEITSQKIKLKPPKKFQVIMLNDDFTAMEFVVEVLVIFFSKQAEEAKSLMLKVHIEGEAVCGVYSFDVAQTKVTQVIEFSRKNEQPLMCIIRELSD